MKLHRLRTQRALTLQTWLREDCPEYGEAEVRYVDADDIYRVNGGKMWFYNEDPVRWDGSGFYWTTGDGKTWTLIGYRYHQACQWMRSKARVSSGTPRKRPPSLAEVMDAVAGVVGVVAAGAGVFRG